MRLLIQRSSLVEINRSPLSSRTKLRSLKHLHFNSSNHRERVPFIINAILIADLSLFPLQLYALMKKYQIAVEFCCLFRVLCSIKDHFTLALTLLFSTSKLMLAGGRQVSKHFSTAVFCDLRGVFGLDSVGV